jgi:hypothetical protein
VTTNFVVIVFVSASVRAFAVDAEPARRASAMTTSNDPLRLI